ncbi:hypothetical protein AURDEDRAFT_169207 [Auricularia subglabra TFB-10046 SS5]|nr:hypothetical protein AURDEDRAFT_169207 [Auricularia subglabra TFB-10046 SS5]
MPVMILVVCGFFALMFGAVLLLELEETFRHLQSWVRTRCVAAFPGLARRRWERRLAKASREHVASSISQSEAASHSHIDEIRKDDVGTGHIVGETVRPATFATQDESPATESSESDIECEATEEMLHHANTVTATHALRFPRASLSVVVQPPSQVEDDDDARGRHRIRTRIRTGGCEQRELLRVHEGYMIIEDRLLRFKSAGGRDKSYEVWHASKWREAKRQEIWIQNDADETERVALICVLEGTDCWAPLRVRGSGWIECAW